MVLRGDGHLAGGRGGTIFSLETVYGDVDDEGQAHTGVQVGIKMVSVVQRFCASMFTNKPGFTSERLGATASFFHSKKLPW